jgi:RHS repeat-associated protein
LPFGEEIGGSGEGEKHKFGSYERDGTGLDYAVNRYYDPQQGRFNQVDPLGMGAANLADPQSLNLYNYVQNDPVNSVDPSGLLKLIPKRREVVVIIIIIAGDDDDDSAGGAPGGSQGGGSGGRVQLPNISTPKITVPVQRPPIRVPPPNFNGNCGVNPLTDSPGFTAGPRGTVGRYNQPGRGTGQPEFDSPRTRTDGTAYGHRGADMAARANNDVVFANRAGTVTFAGRGGGRAGNLIAINHGGGLETRYLHVESIGVRVGERVQEGYGIALAGTSGRPANVTDPHLHFEVRINGVPTNPVKYLNSSCPPPAPPPRPRR